MEGEKEEKKEEKKEKEEEEEKKKKGEKGAAVGVSPALSPSFFVCEIRSMAKLELHLSHLLLRH